MGLMLEIIAFSSAFNTTQPHILTSRLLEQFALCNNLVGWIRDFLTKRKMEFCLIKFDQVFSAQRYVLLHLLFIL